jgi:hypothetical protein
MKHEIASILRDAADRIAAIENKTGPTPAPALPEPSEGFHPAMRGPLKVWYKGWSKDIAKFKDDAWDHTGWAGSIDGVFALRIGSDIARLNGLGLKLGLGKTYATNAGEIVRASMRSGTDFGDDWRAMDVKRWNSIGQALIDGVAQPLDHPGTIKEEIPGELLPLPALPDGFKEWRARGYEWEDENFEGIIAYRHGFEYGWEIVEEFPNGCVGAYYLEAIPADKPERKAREWGLHRHELNDFMRAIDGPAFPHGKEIRVREILPGEPTQEQVQALVSAVERLSEVWFEPKNGTGGLANEIRAQVDAALAPFRKP